MDNIHRFVCTIISRKGFDLTILGFSIIASWLSNIAVRPFKFINMAMSMAKKITSTIYVDGFVFTISKTSLLQSFSASVLIKKISIVAIMHKLLANSLSLDIKTIVLTPIMHMRKKLGSVTLAVPKFVLSATPIVALFTYLNEMDGGGVNLLSDYDASYLSAIDYTIA